MKTSRKASWNGLAVPAVLAAMAALSVASWDVSAKADADVAPLRLLRPTEDPSRAVVRVRTGQRSAHTVPRFITGKFAEHLGWNIYNGMDAQVLRNPTFATYPFATGRTTPDGTITHHSEPATRTKGASPDNQQLMRVAILRHLESWVRAKMEQGCPSEQMSFIRT